jgi:phospholipase/lecithinase/hemolysin
LNGTLSFSFEEYFGDAAPPRSGNYPIFYWGTPLAPTSRFSRIEVPPGEVNWDFGRLYTTGEISIYAAGLPDYNANGFVDQGDLDLVLFNWGTELIDPTGAGWYNALPTGLVDQAELDRVLLNWGSGSAASFASSVGVPEPPTWAGALIALLAARFAHWRKRAATWLILSLRAFPVGACAILFSAYAPHSLQAAPVSDIVVFGDSFSDTGNWALANTADGVLSAPYAGGRISNGPLWIDQVANRFNLPAPLPSEGGGRNYAWAGATTGSNTLGENDMNLQISEYLGAHLPAPTDLFVVWGGANDYFAGQEDPSAPVGLLLDHFSALAQAGARNFFVVNQPRFYGISPLNEGLRAHAEDHNRQLAVALEAFRSSHEDVVVIEFDYFSLFEAVVADPAAYGFTNVLDPACRYCVDGMGTPTTGVVSNPGEYYLWDDVHPTAAAHRLIGDAAYEVLAAAMRSAGDYSCNGVVEQSDLDMVLLNWGQRVSRGLTVTAGWNNDMPMRPFIDQEELDRVLANWGNVSRTPHAMPRGATIPEPASRALVAILLAAIVALRRVATLHSPSLPAASAFASLRATCAKIQSFHATISEGPSPAGNLSTSAWAAFSSRRAPLESFSPRRAMARKA